MKRFVVFLVFFWISFAYISSEKFSFKDYQLWRLYPQNQDQFTFINDLELTDYDVIFINKKILLRKLMFGFLLLFKKGYLFFYLF